ncbi:TaqI-like C-terminal specificity domain-containing protein [Olleya sp.]|jgi:type I restriction-modification system DNA methylase subunit|uniref:Eco57I restriction-modification methylase domain-containing protein n=1 Tax=Olleya sp. TaxID=1906788 RepID=UPI0032D8F60A
MSLFQTSVLKQHLSLQDKDVITKAYKKYTKYFLNPTIQDNIRSSKEEEYQGIFLTELFVNILGYTLKPNADFNLVAEYKNQTNARKADGAILNNDVAIGVIELKGTNTKDLESIRKQAFDYKANQKGCVYVITSNFEKLRFYINDATEFEEFNLFELSPERFALFYLCLQKDNVLNNVPFKIKEASVVEEEQITKQFYKDYSLFKRELYRDLVKRNAKTLKTNASLSNVTSSAVERSPEEIAEHLKLEKNVKLTLFKKSQKLIDRYLFIFFAEDRGLLPPNSTQQILDKWKADVDFGDDRPLYVLFKQYFNFLDQGRAGTSKRAEIYAYNGGLFKEDKTLDSLEIDNDLLYKHTSKLAAYDFESQVDVNILGHIFENSLNEIESVNAEIEGGDFDKQKSKRKKDGVFYTPKYITKYIVENTIGKLCDQKKTELGFKEEEYFKGRKNRNKATITKLVTILDDYRDWLLQLTICDPACGSGAFLNQALDFLIKEHTYIDELKTKVLGGGLQFPDIENTILENNIYGVDLNEESVEIAKLSLWLRTAQPRRKLNDLSSNIKCGNSLIDSKAVAGDKAFNWEEQFPKVFNPSLRGTKQSLENKGGFDVIIGNPPYVIVFNEIVKKHLESKYSVFKRNNDLYTAFYNQSIDILNMNGLIGFITPNSFVKGDYFKDLRAFFANFKIIKIVDFNNFLVFDDANVFSAILILQKNNLTSDWFLYSGLDKVKGLIKKGSHIFIPENPIQKRLKKFKEFEELLLVKDVGFNYWSVGRGKVRGDSVGSRVLYNGNKDDANDIPYVKGSNFNRYTKIRVENYLRHNYESFLNENDIFRYSPDILETKPKLIYRQTSSSLIGTIDENGSYCDKTVHVIINKDQSNINLYILLGLFNSKLLNYLYKLQTEELGRAFAQVKTVNIKKLPFASNSQIDLEILKCVKDNLKNGSLFTDVINKFIKYLNSQFQLEKLSRKIQNWHELEFGDFIKEINKAIKTNNKLRSEEGLEEVPILSKKDEFEWLDLFEDNKQKAQALQTQINQTDKEIDAMVYELYGLTEDEIAIVENS